MVRKRFKNQISKIRIFFLDLSRENKLILSLTVDSFLCVTTVWISFLLRLGYLPSQKELLILPSFYVFASLFFDLAPLSKLYLRLFAIFFSFLKY